MTTLMNHTTTKPHDAKGMTSFFCLILAGMMVGSILMELMMAPIVYYFAIPVQGDMVSDILIYGTFAVVFLMVSLLAKVINDRYPSLDF
jgi:hypothetical protein